MNQKYHFIFLVMLIASSSAWSACLERFYSPDHFEKYPGHQIRSFRITWGEGFSWEREQGAYPILDLSVHLERDGSQLVGDVKGYCEREYLDFVLDQLPGWGEEENRGGSVRCVVTDVEDSQMLSFDNPDLVFRNFRIYGNDDDGNPEIKDGRTSALLDIKSPISFKSRHLNPTSSSFQLTKDDSLARVYRDYSVYDRDVCESLPHKAKTMTTVQLWNEVNLESVRKDLARPTVTARNLYHLSALMWDVSSAFDSSKPQKFVNASAPKSLNSMDFEKVLSFAAYTFLKSRYKLAPGNTVDQYLDGQNVYEKWSDYEEINYIANERYEMLDGLPSDGRPDNRINILYDKVMKSLGYQPSDKSVAAEFGRQMANEILKITSQDGSREDSNHAPEESYELVNNMGPIDITQSGMVTNWTEDDARRTIPGKDFSAQMDINYWNPLFVPNAIDQNGNEEQSQQSPLTLFWGRVVTFSDLSDKASADKPGVFFDPGEHLPYLDFENASVEDIVNHPLIVENLEVARISGYLDPMNLKADGKDFDGDGQLDINPGVEPIDVSPIKMGNSKLGTNNGTGYGKVNPVTGELYEPNMVKKADFYRSLAEFWADGPSSETPPGHWNTLANYTMDQMAKQGEGFRWKGQGPLISREEFELKTYLTLNGALHDAAVVAWGIKGYYQGNRPISVLRKLAYYAERDEELAKALVEKYPFLKMVSFKAQVFDENGYPDKSQNGEEITRLAVWAWRGHEYLGGDFDGGTPDRRQRGLQRSTQPARDANIYYSNNRVSGAGWITMENWMPYQKPSFVTPPFPGFVSGHSTFSRAAAEVLAGVTGSPYFPGGLGSYSAPHLEFEKTGQEFDFQWASYFDASDQSGISRIYGGIHASYDDLPAREIGSQVGQRAVETATQFFGQ